MYVLLYSRYLVENFPSTIPKLNEGFMLANFRALSRYQT